MDPYTLAWPLKMGRWTPLLCVAPSIWVGGLPRFGVAPRVGVMESHALAWRLDFGDGALQLGVAS